MEKNKTRLASVLRLHTDPLHLGPICGPKSVHRPTVPVTRLCFRFRTRGSRKPRLEAAYERVVSFGPADESGLGLPELKVSLTPTQSWIKVMYAE